MTRTTWTTLSFTNDRADLPGDQSVGKSWLRMSRLFGRASDPLKEAQREDLELSEHQRRESAARMDHPTMPKPIEGRQATMVANDRPQPVLKPLAALARDVDRASFDARWEAERRENQKAICRTAISDLKEISSHHAETQRAVDTMDHRIDPGNPREIKREEFKLMRRMEADKSRADDITQSCGERLIASARDRQG